MSCPYRLSFTNVWSNSSMQENSPPKGHVTPSRPACLYLSGRSTPFSAHGNSHRSTLSHLSNTAHVCPRTRTCACVCLCVMLSAQVNCVINGFSCLPQLKSLWKADDSAPGGPEPVKLPAPAVRLYSDALNLSNT